MYLDRYARRMEVKKSFYTTVDHRFEIGNLEDVACNLCGCGRYRLTATELDFEIRTCSECGLVYVSPQPCADELPAFYAGMYADRETETVAARSLGHVERHLRSIVNRRHPKGGRLLDIGCGYGRFLGSLADSNWELTGTEISETAIAHVAGSVPSATVHRGLIEDVDFGAGSFDAITMIAVLEHVKDPKATLVRVAQWLAPGGLLLVQVPYIAPFIRMKRVLPFVPIHFEAPRHLYDFSPRTLPRYFRETGLADVRVDIARPYSSVGKLGELLIWGVKAPGLLLHALTGGRYIYPFASAIVVHGVKAA
jgi:SAM-dependent methyltransferase